MAVRGGPQVPVASTHLALQLFEHERHRLAVQVSGRRGRGRVDVGVGVDPDETQVWTLLGVAAHGANGEAAEADTSLDQSGAPPAKGVGQRALTSPVVSPQHDQGVPGADGPARRAEQRLVGGAHASRGPHAHVGLVVFQVVEAEVTEVVDGVI